MTRGLRTAIWLAAVLTTTTVFTIAASDEGTSSRCFSRTYGVPLRDGFQALKPTDDGGFVVAGGVAGPTSTDPSDVLVARMDAAGNVLWARAYGGPLMDFSAGIWTTPDGGFVVGASTKSFAWGDTPYNTRDPLFWLLKLDSDGDVEWERAHRLDLTGGELTSTQAVTHVETDPLTGEPRTVLDGYVLSGHAGGSEADGYVVRLNVTGDVVWAKKIVQVAVQDPTKIVRGVYDEAWRVVQAKHSGGFLVAGWSMTEPHPDKDGWVLKLSDAGETEWFYTYGSPTQQEKLIWIKEVAGHHGMPATFVATGQAQNPLDHTLDAWVLALTPVGVPLWQTVLGHHWGANEEALHVHHVEQADGSHSYVLAGTTTQGGGGTNGFLAGVGTDGAIQWGRAYVGAQTDLLRAIEPTDVPGEFLAAGYTYSWGQGGGDGWIVRFSGQGDVTPIPGANFSSYPLSLQATTGVPPVPEWQSATSEGIRVLDHATRLSKPARESGAYHEGTISLVSAFQAQGC